MSGQRILFIHRYCDGMHSVTPLREVRVTHRVAFPRASACAVHTVSRQLAELGEFTHQTTAETDQSFVADLVIVLADAPDWSPTAMMVSRRQLQPEVPIMIFAPAEGPLALQQIQLENATVATYRLVTQLPDMTTRALRHYLPA